MSKWFDKQIQSMTFLNSHTKQSHVLLFRRTGQNLLQRSKIHFAFKKLFSKIFLFPRRAFLKRKNRLDGSKNIRMESDKIKQSVIQIVRNKIYGNNISKIKLSQEVDGRIFGIKNGEIVCIPDENATEVTFDTNFKKILFGNFYRVVKKIGNKVTAECKNCKSILKDSVVTCSNTRRHLKVCILICDLNRKIRIAFPNQKHHTELYQKYKEDVQQFKFREIEQTEPTNGNEIDIEFKGNKHILFQNYFQILPKKGKELRAVCKLCKSVMKSSTKNFSYLSYHLKVSKIDLYL